MKTMKKPLIFILATLMTMSVSATNALAADIQSTPSNGDGAIFSPQSEVTEWVYRYNNGVLQERLWSRTYAKWLTEWTNV